ncbi:hypothetical protein GCM10028784_03440 [Myceligenerans cantabricum]
MTYSPDTVSSSLLLPERSRLIHIGMPKSGSTAIQEAARGARAALQEHGALYPGEDVNHIKAASWLTDIPIKHLPDPGPRRQWWDRIKQDIDAAGDKRVLFSYEGICWADIDGARHTVENMDGPLHGLLVLRNLGSFAPSRWQQIIKSGRVQGYHEFLREAFSSADPAEGVSPGLHRSDGYSLPARWAEVLGPENLTVVVLEKSHPDRLLSTVEQMLGLPERLLLDVPKGAGANRGLTATESALIVELNRRVLGEWNAARPDHRRLVFNGAVPRLVNARVPGPDEHRIGTPRWALEAAADVGKLLADDVRASGVRVIGDLDELSRVGTGVEDEPAVLPETIPTDIALEALAGMFASATGWDASHTVKQPWHRPGTRRAKAPAVEQVLAEASAKDLVSALFGRLTRRPDKR